MKVRFPSGEGRGPVVIDAAVSQRERVYCKRHGEMAAAMLSAATTRVVAVGTDGGEDCCPECEGGGCASCGWASPYYEYWDHPNLFRALSDGGTRLGACDAVFVVRHAAMERVGDVVDMAGQVSRDLAYLVAIRAAGDGDVPLPVDAFLRFAASALALRACPGEPFAFDEQEMARLRDATIAAALREIQPQGPALAGYALALHAIWAGAALSRLPVPAPCTNTLAAEAQRLSAAVSALAPATWAGGQAARR